MSVPKPVRQRRAAQPINGIQFFGVDGAEPGRPKRRYQHDEQETGTADHGGMAPQRAQQGRGVRLLFDDMGLRGRGYHSLDCPNTECEGRGPCT